MKTILYIIRHAQTEGNVKNTFGGNPKLTEEGKKQARALAKKLPLNKISAVYSSDMDRAVETANIVFNQSLNFKKTTQRKNLRERYYGDLENKPILQSHKNIHNKALKKNHDLMWDINLTTNDETNRESLKRFLREVTDIAKNHIGENIAIVSHGNVMKNLLTYLEYATFDQLRGGALKNTGVIILEFSDDKFNLLEVNGVEKKF